MRPHLQSLFIVHTLITLLLLYVPSTGRSAFVPEQAIEVAAICPPTITFGEHIDCSFDAASEVDSYTFDASGGDRVVIRMARSSNTVQPRFRVYDPDGTEVCAADTGDYGTIAEQSNCLLQITGTYSLRAEERSRTNTGNYTLYVQRLNTPSNAAELAFGQATASSISAFAELDTYTFAVNGDDRVFVRASRTSDTVQPRFRVYTPEGNEVCSADTGDYGTIAEQGDCLLRTAGTYTMLVDDRARTKTGNYTAFVQRLNAPGNAQPLAFGLAVASDVGAFAELDTYTFGVNGDDRVFVRIARTSDTVQPRFNIYAPDGTGVCSADTGDYGTIAEQGSCLLRTAGTYTMLVNDRARTRTGNYTVYIQRLNAPGNAVELAFGQTIAASINAFSEVDTYIFTAKVDDQVSMRMARTSDTIQPRFRIYTPDGTELCAADTGDYGSVAEYRDCLLRTAGTYTVLADERTRSKIGAYDLLLRCITVSCGNNPSFRGYIPMTATSR